MDKTSSRDLERNIIGCLVKHSEVFPKYDALKPDFFSSSFERDVFDLFRSEMLSLNGKEFSIASFLLKIKTAKIQNDYNADSNLLVSHAVEFAVDPKELDGLINDLLLDYKIREIRKKLKLADEWLKVGKLKTHKVLSEQSDKLSGHLLSINDLGQDGEIKNLSDGLGAIEERMMNPKPIAGFKSSLAIYHSRFGSFRPKEYHVFHASQGVGKSSLLMQLALEFVDSHTENRCLYLDRELAFEHQIIRTTMSNTGVHHEDIESGIYENEEHKNRVVKYLKEVREKRSLDRLDFVEVRDRPMKDIKSLVKSWRFKQDKDKPSLVIYDYLNVGKKGQREDGSWLDLSDQISELKVLCKESNMILITAMQTNRSGDARNRNSETGTSNSIGASYKAVEDSNHSMFLQNKTDEEIAADERIQLDAVRERWTEFLETGNDDLFRFGTHKITAHKNRWPGKRMINSYSELVKRDYENNPIRTPYYINVCLCRGRITEKGDVFNVIAHQLETPHPSEEVSNPPNRQSNQEEAPPDPEEENGPNEEVKEDLF